MARQDWYRLVTVRKANNRDWQVIVGFHDPTVSYPTVIGRGVDPVDALLEALAKRCTVESAQYKAIADRARERLTSMEDKGKTHIAELDAELELVDAGIAGSRAARHARDDAKAEGVG